MATDPLIYLAGFAQPDREKAWQLAKRGVLEPLILDRHAEPHTINDDAALYAYAQDLKRTHLKSAPPLGKVRYCSRIATVHRALGLHTYAIQQQGAKLVRKHRVRIGTMFRDLPADFLRMIVVHELAHLRHKDHDKAFYRLCEHLDPEYHRNEADLRLLLFARACEARRAR